jgi:hypothetical protein
MKNTQHNESDTGRGVLVRCPNPSCNYEWKYTGHFFIYATCPSCRHNIKIAENRIEALQQHVQVELHEHAGVAVTSTPVRADAHE